MMTSSCKSLLAALSLAALLCLPAGADDWPTYRHDNARSGATPETLAPRLTLQWTFRAAHPPEPAWPHPKRERPRVRFDDAFYTAIAGGTVYFGSSADGTVYALDAATGRQRWTFITGGPVRLAPTVAQDRVYFGSDDGWVYCLSATDGALVWKVRAALEDRQLLGGGRMISTQPPRAGVLVSDGVAYFACGIFPNEGVALAAVHAETGRLLWRNDTFGAVYQRMPHGGTEGFTGISPQGYMLASSERIYVPSGRSVPAAFGRRDGRLLFWHGATHHQGGTWALLADDVLYSDSPRLLPPEATARHYDSPNPRPGDGTRLSYDSPRLMGRDAAKGSDRFVAFPGERIVVTKDASYVQNRGIVTAIDRRAYAALGARENQLVKKLMSHFWRYYRPSLDRRVFSRRMKGRKKPSEADKAALDSANQKLVVGNQKRDKLEAEMKAVKQQIADLVKWRCDTECSASMVVAGTFLYVAGEGKVRAIDTQSGEIAWTGRIEGTGRGLAVSDGRLVVSSDNGRLYCFAGGQTASPEVVTQRVDSAPYPHDDLTAVYADLADAIAKRSRAQKGYCLVYGCREGRLLYELLKRIPLRIYGYEPDAAKVAAARAKLARAGMLGTRANVFQADLSRLPCNDYCANLIVSEAVAMSGRPVGSAQELFRVLRPCGGVALLGQTKAAGEARRPLEAKALAAWVASVPKAQMSRDDGVWARLVRGPLPGAGQWTHEYANAANTGASQDQLVRAPFRLLWFGRPGMAKVVDRHARCAAPLAIDGILLHQGINCLWGIDAYNGFILWERDVPGAMRTNVSNSCSNLCAMPDAFFVVTGDKCLRVAPRTGRTLASFAKPKASGGTWAWVATDGARLYGSAGRNQHQSSETFAIDLRDGSLVWTYRAGFIHTSTLALAHDRLFFLDARPSASEVEQVRRAPKRDAKPTRLPSVPLPGQPYYPGSAAKADVRTLVALDARTGKALWRTPMDLSAMGKSPGVLCDQGVILVFANMDGSRLAAVSANDGAVIWERETRYFRRPAVIRGTVYTLPCAYDLRTGELRQRTNPITGKPTPFAWSKAYGCGAVAASQHTMFFRSGSLAYYDVTQDVGVGNFGGLKPNCWISQIAAGGLWLAPEGSAGCTCAYPIRSTVALRPAGPTEVAWSCYVTGIPVAPVEHLAANLGAPGDRRDSTGRVWFAWPRPKSRFGLKLPIKAEVAEGLGYFSHNPMTTRIAGTDKPWVYCSGCCGLSRCVVPLRDRGQGQAAYTVRLHFVEPTNTRAGQRVFDVKLQGRTVLKGFDVLEAAGKRNKAVVKTFSNIKVTDVLTIELVPRTEALSLKQAPIITGFELDRVPDAR